MLLDVETRASLEDCLETTSTPVDELRPVVPDELDTGAKDLRRLIGRVEAQSVIPDDGQGPRPTPRTLSRTCEILAQTAYEMMRRQASKQADWEFPLGAVTTDGQGAIRIEWAAGRDRDVALVVGEAITYVFAKTDPNHPGAIAHWSPSGLGEALHEIRLARSQQG